MRVEVLVAQSCLTLHDPMDCSLPGSSVPGFFRQEHWSGQPFPSPGDLPDPWIAPRSPAFAGRFFTKSLGKLASLKQDRVRDRQCYLEV